MVEKHHRFFVRLTGICAAFLRPAFLVLGEKWLSIKVLTLLMDALVLAILNACGVKVPSPPPCPPDLPPHKRRVAVLLFYYNQGMGFAAKLARTTISTTFYF
jgi:hypothetical protein